MKENKHLSKDGITEIIELSYKMNNLGSRRYKKDHLLRIVGKMKV